MPISKVLIMAAGVLAASTGRADAQETPPAPTRSTLAGVYTEAQATRGEETFAGMCMSCHPPSEHTGPVFMSKWAGKPLWELYVNIKDLMPQDNPGSLSAQEYAQVTAYILKLNSMPAGAEELPADTVALKLIQLDTIKTGQPASTRNRLK
jgi:mono/diheme cytochrome c family protein